MEGGRKIEGENKMERWGRRERERRGESKLRRGIKRERELLSRVQVEAVKLIIEVN